MNDYQYQRLLVAKKTKKFGHLASWEELYYFQKTLGTVEQRIEIGNYAARSLSKKEKIILPLMEQAKLDKQNGVGLEQK